MSLTTPPLALVVPGQPVTAEAWNAIVTAVTSLYGAVIALGGATLDVAVSTGVTPLPAAEVVAEPLGEGRPVRALPPYGARVAHLLVGLTDGQWRIHVRAAGFTTEVRDISLPRTEPLAVSLTRAGVLAPDLFGVSLQAALAQVRTLGIDTDQVLDTTGLEVSRTAVPSEYVDAPVLAQLPEAGTVLAPGTGRMRLVVASALRRDPVVTMPDLNGLSQNEASKVLEKLGLHLGTVTTRKVSEQDQ